MREAHVDRLHSEGLDLPCSLKCANWLRFGFSLRNPSPGRTRSAPIEGARPGEPRIGGRRAQVSRHWSGKTLAEHKADRAAVVRGALGEAGVGAPATGRMAANLMADDGSRVSPGSRFARRQLTM